MFRIEETRGARFARTALPAALSVLLLGLAGLAALVLFHVREKRALVEAAIEGRLPPDRALRAIAPLLGGDVLLLGLSLILAIAIGLAFAAALRAYAETHRRLRELKIFAADVLESLSTGVVTLDLEGRVTAINGQAAALLGIDPRETRVHHSRVLERWPILCDAAEKLLERAPFQNLELSVPGRGGASRILHADGSLLETSEGERIGAVLQVTDVTAIKRIEAEIRRSEHLASLGTLAASVAHEIRNPLAALGINLQLLEEALAAGRTPGEARRYVRVIETELRRLDGIVENFIRFARSRPAVRERVDLARLVEETLALVEPECRRHGIAVERRGLEAFFPDVLGDEDELKQAILNVVLNAVQAMPEGGALVLALARAPGAVRLSVRDSGRGIPAAIRERIFEPFFTTRERGTGLGLAIAKKIVAAHGGRIEFESREGEGTTFTISLPLAADSEGASAPPEKGALAASLQGAPC
jgi:PAS domain S-box-containing protein